MNPPGTESERPLRIVCNGYVEPSAGSIATAGFMLLQELLERGHDVTFVSKKSFVHPRSLLERFPNLSYQDVGDAATDRVHKLATRFGPVTGLAAAWVNHRKFGRRVMGAIQTLHEADPFDVAFFSGVPAFGRVPGLPAVSWVQGAPGSDVRSLTERGTLLRRTEGRIRLAGMKAYGRYRLTLGLPDYASSDRVIVGSSTSRELLTRHYGVDPGKTAALAYPIDLSDFSPRPQSDAEPSDEPLRLLWLGRIVPRKRLDLLLDAAKLAIEQGCRLHIDIVGNFGFAKGLRKLLDEFPMPEYLSHHPRVPRPEVVGLLRQCDVLVQPSDDEDFGSSVAEAMACGTPVVVGKTNGTGDFMCDQSVRLTDDLPETFAAVLHDLAARKKAGRLLDPESTRRTAEEHFDVRRVVDQLERMLRTVAAQGGKR